MDVIKEIRKAYVALFATAGVPAYDRFLPDNSAAATYVIITAQDTTEQIDKCDNGHVTSVQIDITHRTTTNSGGIECDNVAEVIIPLIKGEQFTLPVGIKLVPGSTRKSSDSTLDGISDTFRVYRRLIRFEHIVKTT